jgi:hypothetical protein
VAVRIFTRRTASQLTLPLFGLEGENSSSSSFLLPGQTGILFDDSIRAASSQARRSVTPPNKEQSMITALVQFKLPAPISLEQAREIFESTAPKYKGMQGLIRKYYLLSEDGAMGGGVYLWESREDAERVYTGEWKQFVTEKYGTAPTVVYFDTPVIVDNLSGQILKDE